MQRPAHLVKRSPLAHDAGQVRANVAILVARVAVARAALLGAAGTACTFVPPPPLPEEAAEQGAVAPKAPAEDGASAGAKTGAAEPAAAGAGSGTGGAPAAEGDPLHGDFPLAAALEGISGSGKLWAVLDTERGPIACELFEDAAPRTVANFVGLARGLRPFLDPADGTWKTRPFYDGTIFHRVIPGFMIQGGDPTGTGTGGAGYTIPDEIRPDLRFDVPGRLAMAGRGPNTASSQFFVTLAPASHLDGQHTIFGQCTKDGVKIADDMAMVPRGPDDRPKEPERIERVRILRSPTPPADPPGKEDAP